MKLAAILIAALPLLGTRACAGVLAWSDSSVRATYVLSNLNAASRGMPPDGFATTVNELQRQTGMDFFSELDDDECAGLRHGACLLAGIFQRKNFRLRPVSKSSLSTEVSFSAFHSPMSKVFDTTRVPGFNCSSSLGFSFRLMRGAGIA